MTDLYCRVVTKIDVDRIEDPSIRHILRHIFFHGWEWASACSAFGKSNCERALIYSTLLAIHAGPQSPHSIQVLTNDTDASI